MNKGNVAVILMLIRLLNPEPDASNFVRFMDMDITPEQFEIMNTIMTAVNIDPLLLNPAIVASILLVTDIRLLYNLPPRPPGINVRVYLEPVGVNIFLRHLLENDAVRDATIARMHEIMEVYAPPPAKKKGGRKSKKNKKNKKRKRRSRRN